MCCGCIEGGSWIDARILHKELGVGKEFVNWIKGRISKYEFIEYEDWKLTFAKTGKRKNVKINNYSLALDMAKELSMVENWLSGGSDVTVRWEMEILLKFVKFWDFDN